MVRLRVPPITVTAEKEPEDVQQAPVSVTAVTKDTLEASGARTVSDAADFAPNTYFHEFGARKLSNPRFRGVGAGPLNPGVTTYIDGVPQLTANTSSIELADVERIEFVRGPQSALYGRNSLGGVVNIVSTRPSLDRWTGSAIAPFGSFGTADVRASVSGPLAGQPPRARHLRRLCAPRRVHRERGHRQRPRFALRLVHQGAAALDALVDLGDAVHPVERARARRRLRAAGPRVAARPAVRRGARL